MKAICKTLLAAIAVLFVSGVSAQEDPQKETVIVNPFTRTSSVSGAVNDNVRAAVLSGFSERGRFHIVDALTDATLTELYGNRSVEDVVNDANWQSESTAVYKKLNAKKVVIGQTNDLTYSVWTSGDTRYNKAEISFSLRVYNIEDGSMGASETIVVEASDADSRDLALTEALKEVRRAMTKFVDDHFKFETYILELGQADKKGRVKELYISGGTEMGVAKKTRFKVFAERKIGPKVTTQEIGTIVAKEPMDGVTLCEVADGDVPIKDKFNSGEKLIVVLDKQNTAAGAALRGLNPFRK